MPTPNSRFYPFDRSGDSSNGCFFGLILQREFDDFLFVPIGADRNEMPLTVLSALSRLDLDPWEEAAELSELPKDTATQRLARRQLLIA